MKLNKTILLFIFMSFFILSSHVVLAKAKEPVGKLMFTIGKVIIVSDNGKKNRVRRGAKVFEGDLIKTNKKGQAQIKFKDGARISVRSNSEFKIEAYVYNAKTNKKNYKSELSLLKGGIRSITGAIGKSNKKSYKMKTVIATIGIRGTDYSLMLCDQDCSSPSGGVVNDGLYVGVVNGGVTVENDAGRMDVSPNQYAMVGSARSLPIMLPKAPSFLMFDKTSATKSERTKVAKSIATRISKSKKNISSNRGNRSSQTSGSNAQQRQSNQRTQTRSSASQSSSSSRVANVASGTRSSVSTSSASAMTSIINNRYADTSEVSLPVSISDVDLTQEINITETTFETDSVDSQVTANTEPDEITLQEDEIAASSLDQGLTSTNTDATALPENGVSRFINFIFGSEDVQGEVELSSTDPQKIYSVDPSDANRTTYIEYSLDSTKLYDFGEDTNTGLSWGRWSSGTINQVTNSPTGVTTSSVDMTNQSIHWIMGVEGSDTVLLPITGTRDFVLIGNTNPTDNMGNVGFLGSASLTADFDANTVGADVNLSINQQIWEGSNASIPLDMQSGEFSTDQLSVQVNGGTNTSGSISGGLTSGTTNGAGFTYSMDATVNGEINTVTGAAAFQEVTTP